MNPQPTSRPRPLMMSAATSDLGIDFAARQCDAIFVSALQAVGKGPEEMAKSYSAMAEKVRSAAESHDRKVRICAMSFVVMDETDEKAAETVKWLEDEIDIEAVRNQFARVRGVPAGSVEMDENWVRSLARGLSGHQIFGSYATVANELACLYEAGIEHVAMCFWDPARSVEAFGEHVIPLLRERGFRR